MATIYANSLATGANNGTSFANGYTNLATAITALISGGAGSTLYTNSTWKNPFVGSFTINALNNFQVRMNEGPDKQSVLFGGVTNAGWTDQTGGVFRVAVTEPTYVAYNNGQDDYLGTLSGQAVTADVAAYCVYAGQHPSKARAWPIFLVKTAGTQSTPGVGEYGYTGGFLYVRPLATAPSLANIIANTYYSNSAQQHGLYLTNCNDWDVIGGTAFFYPLIPGNFGYGFRGDNCVRGRFIQCDAHVTGWHGIGFAGAAGGSTGDYDCQIIQCLSNGCTGDSELGVSGFSVNNFVFYQHNAPTRYGNNYGIHCLAIPTPRLRISGRPVATSWLANAFLSHSASGITAYRDVFWRRCVGLDFTDPIVTKHAMSMNLTGTFIEHSQGAAPLNALSLDSYNVKAEQCISYGRSGVSKSPFVGYKKCMIDRGGHGNVNTTPTHGSGISTKIYFQGCTIISGSMPRAFFEVVTSDDIAVFDGGRVLLTSKDDGGVLGFRCALVESATDNTGDNIYLKNGLQLDGDGNPALHSVLRASDFATVYTNGPRDVVSDGTIRYGNKLEGYWQQPSQFQVPQNFAYYQANVAGASTDTAGNDFGWGETVAERANTLRRLFLDENRAPVQYN